MFVATDFDGTVTKQDSLKLLLDHFAGSAWHPIEEAMKSGVLPERVGLKQAMDCLQISFQEARDFILANVELDPDFIGFVEWTKQENVSLAILSGGFQEFIYPLLEKYGIEGVEVLANSVHVDNGSWKVLARKGPRMCENLSHCKCASMLRLRKDHRPVIYIGDGHSDRCAVGRAELVFAKSWLAEFCQSQSIEFIPFRRFQEVRMALSDTDAAAKMLSLIPAPLENQRV